MSFVIDSSDWDFINLSCPEIANILENFLDRLYIAKERGEEFFFGNEFQSKNVCRGMDLWTFLCSPESAEIDKGIKDELASYINRGCFYEDMENLWPPTFLKSDVTDSSGAIVGLDYAYAYHNLINNTPFACISLRDKSKLPVSSTYGQLEIYFVNSEKSNLTFWRECALSTVRDTQENLHILSSHLYPDLYFFKGVWDGIDSFEGGYSSVYQKLKKYLEVFNDYGNWIYSAPPPAIHITDTINSTIGQKPTNELIEERFQALGLCVAPEKPDVRKNEKCRKEREIVINKTTHYCEWHGKFEPHQNRIHVHGPTSHSAGKFIIAIFCKHLSLPKHK
ncbi:hypothetical protein GXP72_18705 [Enterobacter sp. SES19]|uniref:hypothetical protein n=1 Tax=unclassified Enterobacter TaxID=2608935 RepID=UPI0008EBD1DB|nr:MULTISPECIES: hypothetical protein [unclassified Enterobacter]QIR24349.1 hypothetical protein GXP72_18705 [Enterobacter sp. SES19]SFI21800.1 hypothetical protein SAMN03159336_2332 [Enterobacter sp. NFIX59]